MVNGLSVSSWNGESYTLCLDASGGDTNPLGLAYPSGIT